MEIIKIESYEDFLEKVGSVFDLRNSYDLMDCSLELAEKILNHSISYNYSHSSIRCTQCGSNLFVKNYVSLRDIIFDSRLSEEYLDKEKVVDVNSITCKCCNKIIN